MRAPSGQTTADRRALRVEAADHRARSRPDYGLAFDLLSSAHQQVMTGHHNGVITLDLPRATTCTGTAARRDGRAVPHAARALPPRDRPLLLLPADRHVTGYLARFASCSATLTPTTRPRWIGITARVRPRAGSSASCRRMPPCPERGLAETFAHYLHIRDALDTSASCGLPGRGHVRASPLGPALSGRSSKCGCRCRGR
ncbi:hypothetical protein I553_10228 [Mycobacterium xenopi 4042]|uniref:Uncharacterized protein n=1 Tax=Mycobacterium xenopi 4042 TaxID=1299334 RepID=X7ZK49_MYCXE|nr:hypothetical protein I553_10228 [Mycobacterium xenopi 4042]